MAVLTPSKPVVEAPAAVPQEPTTPMKLSEAIRLGCLVTEPLTGTLWDHIYNRYGNPIREYGRACALGAAAIGRFGLNHKGVAGTPYLPSWIKEFGLPDEKIVCPVSRDCAHVQLPNQVTHLNDHHEWDRLRIADWLDSKGL